MARFTSPDANGAPGPTGPAGAPGVGVPDGGTAGQILAKIDSEDYNTYWMDNYATYSGYTATVKHEVKASESINKGQAVYVSSADGTNMIVSKASNSTETTSSKTMGLMEDTVSTNGKANVITEGLLAGLNTNGATAGDPVWLGTNGNLIYGLANKPSAPAHLVFIGIVTRANANNGEIFIRPQNGFELDELHTVSLEATASITDNEVLAFDSTSGLWKNQTASEANLVTKGAFNYTQTLGSVVNSVSNAATLVSGSITTNGYPVHIIATGDGEPSAGGAWARLQLFRDSSPIGQTIQVECSAAGENINYALQIIDTPAAGTYTYSLRTTQVAGGVYTFGEVSGPVLCIMELGK